MWEIYGLHAVVLVLVRVVYHHLYKRSLAIPNGFDPWANTWTSTFSSFISFYFLFINFFSNFKSKILFWREQMSKNHFSFEKCNTSSE